MVQKIKDFFIGIYQQLVKMDDSPQRIAIAFGLGVFTGILPGPGPLAAVALAYVFRVNKAAAFLGSVLTNGWLSLVTFILAIKTGCAVLGIDAAGVLDHAHNLAHNFSWKTLWDVSLTHLLKPLLLGFTIVGLLCGLAAYVLALILLKKFRRP